jgi:hypothetical protein
MKSAILTAIIIFSIFVPRSYAQSQPVNTGLGECVDFVIYGSSTLTDQVNGTSFQFMYAAGSYTDKAAGIVYVQNYACDPNNLTGLYSAVSQVSHEMGHVYFDQGWPLGTREDYIEKACTNEGRAVLNNSTARSEIISTSMGGADIGLIAANASALLAIIAAGGDDLALRVGDEFCLGNVTSTTGENYKVYYGNEYDRLYGTEPDEEE